MHASVHGFLPFDMGWHFIWAVTSVSLCHAWNTILAIFQRLLPITEVFKNAWLGKLLEWNVHISSIKSNIRKSLKTEPIAEVKIISEITFVKVLNQIKA